MNVLKQMPARSGPDVFFSFPGVKGSVSSIIFLANSKTLRNQGLLSGLNNLAVAVQFFSSMASGIRLLKISCSCQSDFIVLYFWLNDVMLVLSKYLADVIRVREAIRVPKQSVFLELFCEILILIHS